MTFDDVRKFALTWPEVEDGTSYGAPALKVRKKMLARLKEDADSRVTVRDGGVGLLPIDNLVGRADAVVGSWDMGIRSQPVWTWLSGFRVARFFTSVH